MCLRSILRASRTVPFISKAIGWPVARVGALVMAGVSLTAQDITAVPQPHGFFVKEAVFPFDRIPGVDTLLGPEMRSTGEVMGMGNTHTGAFLRATEAIGPIPIYRDRPTICEKRRQTRCAHHRSTAVHDCGFNIMATRRHSGLHHPTCAADIPVKIVHKVKDQHPTVVDAIRNGEVKIVINTVTTKAASIKDSMKIRRSALTKQVLYFTTIESAKMIAAGIQEKLNGHSEPIMPIQKRYHLQTTPQQ